MTDVLVIEEDVVLSPEEMARELEVKRLREIDSTPLRKMVQEFRDGTDLARQRAERSRRYYDGRQLDDALINTLRRRGQPRVVRNEIKPAVNGLLGILQQAKVDPRAYPRNPNNEDQADVASKALRYVAEANRWHKTKIDMAENHLIEGVCAAMVEVDGQSNVRIHHVPYDELIYDPRSKKADFSDAVFLGVGKWLYEQDVASQYPDFREDLSAAFDSNWSDIGLDRQDKPNDLANNWTDKKKRRLFIVELYHRDAQWNRSVFYVGGVLEQDVSPYRDDEGEPVCPMAVASCFIDGDNQRYGVVDSMLSPQDELNAYASRLLHIANSRQLQVPDPNYPPEVDSDTARREASKPDGLIPSGYQIVPTADLSIGMQNMMADARQALVRQAPTPAVLADAGAKDQSGRSRLVLQQAGMTEIARALGRLEDEENAVYRQIWMRLKQFKQEPWWVRITGEEGKAEFTGLNIPIGPDGQQAQPGQPVVAISNRLAEMDVDIEVETVPDTANLQAEQFEGLAPLLPQLAEAYGIRKAFQVGLALSAIPDKGRIKQLLEAPEESTPEQQQAQMQQQQMAAIQAQLAQEAAQAQIAKDMTAAELNQARANAEQADTVLKAAQFSMGQPIDAS